MLNATKRGLGLTAAGILLLLYPDPPTSSAIVPDLPPPPSAEELARLEHLASWVWGPTAELRSGREPAKLVAALRERRESFELFRRFPAEPDRRELTRRLPYGDIIEEMADQSGIDSLLLAAVVEAESSFDAGACSRDGALGLMQVLPSTAADLGSFDLTDPRANIRAGSIYLGQLLERYDQDLELALAAYNAGPGNVDRYGGIPPFPETVRYVERVLATYVGHTRALWHRDRDLSELLATVGHGV